MFLQFQDLAELNSLESLNLTMKGNKLGTLYDYSNLCSLSVNVILNTNRCFASESLFLISL